MDHLRLPQGPISQYPKAKLLCAAVDEENGLVSIHKPSDYPYNKASFSEYADEVPDLNDAAPFLQAWLWFGLLANVFEIVGVALDLNDFIVDDASHDPRLSTHALHQYLWLWVAAESRKTDTERYQHSRAINGLLDETSEAIERYYVDPRSSDPRVPDIQRRTALGACLADNSSNVLLAIVLLAEALDLAQQDIYRNVYERQARSWEEPMSIRIAMLEAGWCIKEFEWLTNQFASHHVSTLLFLSRIDRHVLNKDHRKCTFDSCAHEKIDYATYRPVHTQTECSCNDLAPMYYSSKRIDHALCHGNIPLLQFQSDNLTFGARLETQIYATRARQMSYVAISHVWSDRMGNLQESALPECQLRRLQEQVNALYPHRHDNVPFWIDTICVPRERTTRAMAFKGMRQVYELADKVLVLDSSLRTLSSAVAPEDLLLRILVAPWSTRLWTFHEGALAQRIYFQLSDCAFNGDDLERTYMSHCTAGADTFQLEKLLQDSNNDDLRRALVRAMALDENGESFIDLQKAAEIVLTSHPLLPLPRQALIRSKYVVTLSQWGATQAVKKTVGLKIVRSLLVSFGDRLRYLIFSAASCPTARYHRHLQA